MPPPVAPQVSLSGNSWEFSRTPTDRTSRIPHHRIRCSILLDCLIGFCAQCTNVHNQSHLESRASGRILPPLTPVTSIDVLTATTTTSNLAMVLEELQNVPGARRKRTRRGCRGGRGKKARCEEGRGGSSREERAPAKAVDAPRACPVELLPERLSACPRPALCRPEWGRSTRHSALRRRQSTRPGLVLVELLLDP